MNITTIVPPPSDALVVTLEQVYDHLRLVPEDSPPTHPQDDMLTRLIKVATGEAESITRRRFVEQTVRLHTDRFPYPGCFYNGNRWWSCGGPGYIELLRPPLIHVQSVSYRDADNVLQTVDADQYYTTDDRVPRLTLIDGFSFPTLYTRDDAVVIDYVVGYPPEGSPAEDYAANIPEEIKQAVLLGVEMHYRSLDTKNREVFERARAELLSDFVVYTIV
jgi:uncharacterized phiE125 gp8 family phage protein